MREQQAADDYQAERLAGFAAGAVAKGDRHGAEQGGHGGHHDRAEADQAAFVDGLLGAETLVALGFEGEVDLHDGVLLDDADQHDEPDEGVDAQIDLEDHQREERAEAGGREAGEDRNGVDVAFVQDAQHDVHHQNRNDQQHPEVAERAHERLGGALEVRADRSGKLLVG